MLRFVAVTQRKKKLFKGYEYSGMVLYEMFPIKVKYPEFTFFPTNCSYFNWHWRSKHLSVSCPVSADALKMNHCSRFKFFFFPVMPESCFFNSCPFRRRADFSWTLFTGKENLWQLLNFANFYIKNSAQAREAALKITIAFHSQFFMQSQCFLFCHPTHVCSLTPTQTVHPPHTPRLL